MNVGGNLFELEASLTLDTSDYESAVEDAIDSADELSDALDSVSEDVDVDVSANTDDAVEGINGVTEAAEGASDGVSGISDTIVNILAGAATFGAISSVTTALTNMINATTAAGDRIDKQSDQLGLTRKAYQEWDYIMQLCGSDVATMGRMMNKLADPSDSVADGIKALGINMKEFSALSREDQFATVIKGLQGISDPTERAAAAQEIFGNQWKSIATLMEQSPDYIDNCKQAMEDLGMYMSDEDVDAAASFSDSLTTLSATVESLKNDLIADLLPAIQPVVDALARFVGGIHDLVSDDSTVANIERIGEAFVGTVQDINNNELEAQSIIDAMDALGDPSIFDEAAQAQWDGLYKKLLEVCPELRDQFGDTATAVDGMTDSLRDATEELFTNARAQAMVKAQAEQMDVLAEAYANVTNAQIEQTIAQNKYNRTISDAQTAMKDALDVINNDNVSRTAWESTGALADGLLTSAEIQQYAASVESVGGYVPDFGEAQAAIDSAASSYDELNTATENLAQAQEDLIATQERVDAWVETFNALSGAGDAADDAADTVGSAASDMDTNVTNATDDANNAIDGFERNWNNTKLDPLTAEIKYKETGKPSTSGLPEVKGYATGLDYVPYNDYRARLHEGEAVLTKIEATAWRAGQNTQSKSISSAQMEALATMIASAVSNAPISFGVDGKDIAVAQRDEAARQSAIRTAQVSNSMGWGA